MPALNDDDLKKLRKALAFLAGKSPEDRSNRLYYMGRQVLTHMGLAVPAAMRQLEVVINWPRVVVDTIEERQDVKSILVPQDEGAADTLRRLYDANDLESELSSWKRDRLIYGRGFLSVGANEEDPSTPILQVESPTQMCVKIDRRHRRVAYAVRLLKSEETEEPDIATLYTPDYTVIARNRGGIWTEEDRDDHKLGVVPVFPSFNRRMTGEYVGQTEMADVIPLTDAALRTMTNLQVAVEALAVPKRWIFGIKQGDFASLDGWFNYLQPFLAHANANAKAGQFAAADLKNFHSTLESYGKLCASVTGFPARYFGMTTANPPAEGAIIAEEAKLIKRVERVNAEAGIALSAALRFAAKLAGKDIPAGFVNIKWHDPATPTYAQKADAVQKLSGGKPLLSREGAWDELGWDDSRKDQEREYFRAEAEDPALDSMMEKLANDEDTGGDVADVPVDAERADRVNEGVSGPVGRRRR